MNQRINKSMSSSRLESRPSRALRWFALGGLVLASVNALAQAPAPASNPPASSGAVATVTHLSGTLTVKRSDGSTRFLSVKSNISEGDTVVTAQGTYARMKFADGAETVLRPDSQMKVDAYKYEDKKPEGDNVLLSLIKGGMRSVTGLLGKRNRDKVQIATPTATIGIRGTHFGLLVCNNDCGGIPTPRGGPPGRGRRRAARRGPRPSAKTPGVAWESPAGTGG